MRHANFHAHTVFSDGAHTVEENVREAQAQNMLALGFSDHSCTVFDSGYCMSPEKYGLYRKTVEACRRDCAVPLFCGIELDAFSQSSAGEFDFTIASAHYVFRGGEYYAMDRSPQEHQRCIREAFGGSLMDMLRCYCDTLGEHVAKINPTFVGHVDLPAKFCTMPEDSEEYRGILEDAIKHLVRLCPYLEMNTGAISRGYREVPYPAPYLLDCIRREGGRIVLNSDSHRAEHLTYRFDECVTLLKEKGFREIYIFNGKTMEPVALE